MSTRTIFTLLSLPLLATVVVGASACSAASSDSQRSAKSEAALTAPTLGTAGTFAILGGSMVSNTGATVLHGDVGVSPGLAITGFPPATFTEGTTHAGDAIAQQGQADLITAYDALTSEACTADLTGTDLGGLTLTSGVYCFSSSAQLTGDLVLDAGGRADAVFVFKTVSTLTTASNASVRVINGGNDCNVFWQIGSSATLGTTTAFAGNVLALTSISLNTGARVSGRALAHNGAVTMDTNAVSMSQCSATPASDAGAPQADSAVTPDAAVPPVEIDAGTSEDAAIPEDAAPPVDAATPEDANTSDAAAPTPCCPARLCDGGACLLHLCR